MEQIGCTARLATAPTQSRQKPLEQFGRSENATVLYPVNCCLELLNLPLQLSLTASGVTLILADDLVPVTCVGTPVLEGLVRM